MPKVFDADNGWATVIGIDPGGTTGWAVMCVYPDALADPEVSVLRSIAHWACGQVNGPENEQAQAIVELIAAWPHAAVVNERFTLRTLKMSRELLSPIRIAEKIDFAMWHGMDGILPAGRRLWQQDPSTAMNVATDDRLKAWKLYKPGEEHARDAVRHCITFLRRASDRKEIRSSAWPRLYAKDGSLLSAVGGDMVESGVGGLSETG